MANGLRDALDAAWGDFTTDDVGLDWLRYTGNARPERWWVEAVTRHSRVTFIFETVSTRSQEGVPAGMMDCSWAELRALDVHPGVASIAVVVSDGNGRDNWSAYDYGYGWGLRATIAFFPYGAKPICQSFLDGARAALAQRGMSHLLIDGDWVPETWGDGTLMSQVVGFSPVGNTDLNHVWAPYWPTYNQSGSLIPQQEDSNMISVQMKEGGPDCHLWVDENGKIAFRQFVQGTAGQVITVPARNGEDYKVIDPKPLVASAFGSTIISYAAEGHREAVVTPTGYGPVVDLL